MKFIIILIALTISTLLVSAQKNDRDSLFLMDSITVYLGINNTFKINPNEKFEIIKKTDGLKVKLEKGLISFAPQFTGIFNVDLKTKTGISRILLVSKLFPSPSKN